ncbi:Ca(2+)-dependent cysteine protease, partial [Actinomortierella ambigua]
GDEADGYDEVIFPCDYLRSGIISDDEMYDLLVKELPEGVQLTALIDSCHSGTMLDLPFVYNGDQFTQLEPHMPRAKTGVMAAMTVDEANHANGAVAPSIEPRETNRPQASTSVGFMTGQALENVIAADPVTGSRSTGPESDGASTSLSSSSSPSVLSSSSADSAKRKEGSSADGSTQEGNGQGNGEDKEGSSPPSSKRSKDNQGSTKAPAFALQPAALIEQAPDSSSPLSPTRSESSHSSRKRVKSEGQGLHLFRKTKGNVVMFSGCRDDQASADIRANDKNNTVTKIGPRGEKDSIQGSPAQPFHQPQSFTAPLARGAVTYAWIQCLSRKPEQSYEELLHSMRFFMKQRDLEQVPQLGSGLPMDMNTIFTL